MGFVLRKTLSAILMPLPAALLMGTVGWVLWSRGKRKRLGQGMVVASLVGLALVSIEPVSLNAARLAEGDAEAFPGDSVDFVVVLGHGHVSDPDLPVTAQLHGQALYRLTEGVRIATAQPWERLVLSGYDGVDPKSNAQVYSEMAMELGIPAERLILEQRPTDTAQEAEYLEPVLRGRAFALVTSASHMRRAARLFRARGLEPVPAPTGHLAKTPGGFDLLEWVPSEDHLKRSQTAWYELLGLVWGRMRGDL